MAAAGPEEYLFQEARFLSLTANLLPCWSVCMSPLSVSRLAHTSSIALLTYFPPLILFFSSLICYCLHDTHTHTHINRAIHGQEFDSWTVTCLSILQSRDRGTNCLTYLRQLLVLTSVTKYNRRFISLSLHFFLLSWTVIDPSYPVTYSS